MSAKNTLRIEVCGGPGSGIFFFSALDRLKVDVGKGGDELLIGVAGVLVTSGNALYFGLGNGSGVAARPGFVAGCVEVPRVDDVRVIFPDTISGDAGFCCTWLPLGVW